MTNDDPRKIEGLDIIGTISESDLNSLSGYLSEVMPKLAAIIEERFSNYESIFLEFDGCTPEFIVWGKKI